MGDPTLTQAFAATFVDQLVASGLREVCIAPGSRSAPLAMAFARHPGVRFLVHLDERSAAFFALGLAKATERPVAVLCTSGTAAAEFHGAVVEAHHSLTPLLVLTADRPPELREVGANQAIDQARLYGSAVRWYSDPGVPDAEPDAPRRWRRLAARAMAEAGGPPAGPVHLNLPLREPLTVAPGTEPAAVAAPGAVAELRTLAPGAEQVAVLRRRLAGARRPLLVAGELRGGDLLVPAVSGLRAPILAEPTSQLRRAGIPNLVVHYDALLRAVPEGVAGEPDLVVRVGAAPTSKALSSWLRGLQAPVLVVDGAAGWRDPDLLATELLRCDPAALLAAAGPAASDPAWLAAWASAEATIAAALGPALAAAVPFEGQAVAALAAALPPGTTLFAGNSMAIRAVDSFWPALPFDLRLLANRGASGIDGLVSTALGVAATGGPTALLLGDLSLYHDMNGLWAARRHGLDATILVLDNDGGGIFSFLPQAEHEDVFEDLFGTPLGLDLEGVASLYGLHFTRVDDPAGLVPAIAAAAARPGVDLIDYRFRRPDSVAAHRSTWQAVRDALA